MPPPYPTALGLTGPSKKDDIGRKKKLGDLTDRDRRGHVHMKPGSGEVEAQVSVDEEAGTAGRGIAAVRHRVLHVRDCRAELEKTLQ